MIHVHLQVRTDRRPWWGTVNKRPASMPSSRKELDRLKERWQATRYFEPGTSFRIVDDTLLEAELPHALGPAAAAPLRAAPTRAGRYIPAVPAPAV